MKSDIVEIERWPAPVSQRDDTVCSPHGKKSCARPLVADVYLSDEGSRRIHWTVCRVWLDNEPDVAEFEARRGLL
ncbi:hypothetical protein [Streptomyces phaeochromogenes]|uniref:hypothetical protein n=1 Tax=Streptomyces phaeochromogenes TaxID=1923 RepID=UPI00371D85A6